MTDSNEYYYLKEGDTIQTGDEWLDINGRWVSALNVGTVLGEKCKPNAFRRLIKLTESEWYYLKEGEVIRDGDQIRSSVNSVPWGAVHPDLWGGRAYGKSFRRRIEKKQDYNPTGSKLPVLRLEGNGSVIKIQGLMSEEGDPDKLLEWFEKLQTEAVEKGVVIETTHHRVTPEQAEKMKALAVAASMNNAGRFPNVFQNRKEHHDFLESMTVQYSDHDGPPNLTHRPGWTSPSELMVYGPDLGDEL